MAVNNFQPQKCVPVALFGLGRAGSIHFGSLVRNPKAEIRYIVEEFQNRAEEAVHRWNLEDTCKVVGVSEADCVFSDSSVQAVIVCTPTSTHESIVKRALAAGKSVFCEKPVASTVSAVDACYEEARINGGFLFCAFNRRFDPSIRLLKQHVQDGTLGQVHSLKTCSRDYQLPSVEYLKVSGGIFHDCAIHDIDVVCWLLNEFPEEVFVMGHAFHIEVADCGDVDQTIITMKFPSGTIATIDLNRKASYGYDQRIEVFGTNGMLETKNSGPTSVIGHLGPEGISGAPIETMFAKRYAESYALEMEFFLNHILGLNNSLGVTRKETIMASVIAEACQKSCHSGIPIRINKDI